MLNARVVWSCAALALISGVSPAPAAGPADRSSPERNAERAMRIPAIAEALESCEEGHWRQIPWRDDAAAALAEAQGRDLPLLVFVYKTLETEAGEPLVCLGARISRGSIFADPMIQETVASSFVPLQIDIAEGIPEELGSMNFVQRLHDARGPGKGPGFSASVVLSADGRMVLATTMGKQRLERDAPRSRSARATMSPAQARLLSYATMLDEATQAHVKRSKAQAEGAEALREFDRTHRRELLENIRRAAKTRGDARRR